MGRREEICAKALKLSITEGYDQTTFSRIADVLHLTNAGTYHYFKSKEDLLFSIHEFRLQKNLIPILDAADKIIDPEKRLAFFIGMFSWTFYWFDYERRDCAEKLSDTYIDLLFNGIPSRRRRERWTRKALGRKV